MNHLVTVADCHLVDHVWNEVKTSHNMKSFDPKRFVGATAPLAVLWQIGTVMESKGRQNLYEKQSPEVLRTLRELAIVGRTESSNRIEGVTVEPGRLRPLVLGRARPRDRSEGGAEWDNNSGNGVINGGRSRNVRG